MPANDDGDDDDDDDNDGDDDDGDDGGEDDTDEDKIDDEDDAIVVFTTESAIADVESRGWAVKRGRFTSAEGFALPLIPQRIESYKYIPIGCTHFTRYHHRPRFPELPIHSFSFLPKDKEEKTVS